MATKSKPVKSPKSPVKLSPKRLDEMKVELEERSAVEVKAAKANPTAYLTKALPRAQATDEAMKLTKKAMDMEWVSLFKEPLMAALKTLYPNVTEDTVSFEVAGVKASIEHPKSTVLTPEAAVSLEAMVLNGNVTAPELFALVSDLVLSIEADKLVNFITAKLRTMPEADVSRLRSQGPLAKTQVLAERFKVSSAPKAK